MYSFGTYTRETETLFASSISLASLRASSTGCTCAESAPENALHDRLDPVLDASQDAISGTIVPAEHSI